MIDQEQAKGREKLNRRLIEDWMPIAEIGEESARERRSMTALPPTYYLHVWWARRPLVASRSAILGALLPYDADRKKFMHVLGIHGDPVEAKIRIAQATKEGIRLGKDAYGYPRAFSYLPDQKEIDWIRKNTNREQSFLLDPVSGGGSIPFEAMRLGMQSYANDLNPVSWLILKSTMEFPAKYGPSLFARYQKIGKEFRRRCVQHLRPLFPAEPEKNCIPDGYLWARTIKCPYCDGTIPLSPNWRLNSKGMGVRLVPETNDPANRHIRFEIVNKIKQHSEGTVSRGNGICPYPDCGRVIEGNDIKSQAQEGKMGDQLFAIVYKELKAMGVYKSGKKKGQPKIQKIRRFRSPKPEDSNEKIILAALDQKMPEWLAKNIVPDELIVEGNKTLEPLRYGMGKWKDLFSPRQLYGHCTSVEVFQDLLQEYTSINDLDGLDKAAFSLIALALDKILNYNSRMSVWMPTREVVANTFNRHDFAFCWSYAEMAPTIAGLGYDWTINQTGKAIKELIELVGHDAFISENEKPKKLTQQDLPFQNKKPRISVIHPQIFNRSADYFPEIKDLSADLVVMDPPYYDNVMYAELADYFYVWLKRTAGLLYPEQFSSYLTDKDREAVANQAKFKEIAKSSKNQSSKKLATRDYQERMQAIFSECHRVLKKDGLMVLMFTHKATGAWDALTMGLLEAGFEITASWPINTEAEGSLHIKDKNAAKSTIFLVCRPREYDSEKTETTYWEDVEPLVTGIVRKRVKDFQDAGIGGVDLYLSCFGPALQEFSRHWPMQRGRALQRPEQPRGAQLKLIEDEDWDPYAVRPEDALNAARTAVKDWRLEQISTVQRQTHLDPLTEFFVLAWDAFKSPQFPADEALKLARVVGISFDENLRNKILELKGSDVILWDSVLRSNKGTVTDSQNIMINALHVSARLGREQNSGIARDYLKRYGILNEPGFIRALEAVLNVLPLPQNLDRGKSGPLIGAATDCEALENLRKLAFSKKIPQPKQWQLAVEEGRFVPESQT